MRNRISPRVACCSPCAKSPRHSSAVPGRKTLILFSAGFPLTSERQSELTATIDALNKANIAVYPVDVRGLATSVSPGMDISNPSVPGGRPGFPPSSELRSPESPFPHLPGLRAALAAPPAPEPQHGGEEEAAAAAGQAEEGDRRRGNIGVAGEAPRVAVVAPPARRAAPVLEAAPARAPAAARRAAPAAEAAVPAAEAAVPQTPTI